MEQTLGKRIAENRKRLKLTQDALAEQLGVTAQAVSKWENDQSCPDITTLPRLAEIFGTTTDELLGRQIPERVHEAELVQHDGDPNGVHFEMSDEKDGKWEFHWDSGKRGALAFAVLVLWVGMLTLFARLFQWDVSFWGILWPSVLLVYGINGLAKDFSFFRIGLIFFGAYFLVDNLNIWNFSIAGELIFPIIVVLFGISLLVDALRKPNKPRFTISHNGKNIAHGDEKTRSQYIPGDDSFSCSLSFGEDSHAVVLPRLVKGDASVSFGELGVDLSGCETVSQGCTIDAHCSFGELVLAVPRRFRVEHNSSTAFATVEYKGSPDPTPEGIIYLNANASFGEITIRYI